MGWGGEGGAEKGAILEEREEGAKQVERKDEQWQGEGANLGRRRRRRGSGDGV